VLGVAAEAAERDLLPVGASEDGRLLIDLPTQHDHHGHGYQRVFISLELASARLEDGRSVAKLEETWDWDCERDRYEIVERILRADTGEYIRHERTPPAWRSVSSHGAERRVLELVCKKAGAEPPQATMPLRPPAPRSETVVVEMLPTNTKR
jgi:hypothetical protein